MKAEKTKIAMIAAIIDNSAIRFNITSCLLVCTAERPHRWRAWRPARHQFAALLSVDLGEFQVDHRDRWLRGRERFLHFDFGPAAVKLRGAALREQVTHGPLNREWSAEVSNANLV